MTVPPIHPIMYAARCRCGAHLPKGATARVDIRAGIYDCVACRPRPKA